MNNVGWGLILRNITYAMVYRVRAVVYRRIFEADKLAGSSLPRSPTPNKSGRKYLNEQQMVMIFLQVY